MRNSYVLIFSIILLLIPFGLAIQSNTPYVYNLEPPQFDVIDTNATNNISVNVSNFWNTGDQGPLRNVSQINHFDLNNASLSWSVAAHFMNTFLNMRGFNIINVGTLFTQNVNVTQNITLGNSINDNKLNLANITSREYFDVNGTSTTSG